jgi:hypothetical protein
VLINHGLIYADVSIYDKCILYIQSGLYNNTGILWNSDKYIFNYDDDDDIRCSSLDTFNVTLRLLCDYGHIMKMDCGETRFMLGLDS